MSLRKGAPTKGGQKYQNTFAFKHNPNSKLTKKISGIEHHGLCQRCNDKIEWRKKYRKYKPLKEAAFCNGCKQRSVRRAYHTLCDSCAGGRKICAKCTTPLSGDAGAAAKESSAAAVKEGGAGKDAKKLKRGDEDDNDRMDEEDFMDSDDSE